MQGMNRVILCGRLGFNPEIKMSKNGKPYSLLRLATDRGFMNEQAEWENKTDWHSVFVWGPLAERCAHNFRKGALLYIEGALTYWQVAGFDKGYKNAVQAERVSLIHQPQPGPLDAVTPNADAPMTEVDLDKALDSRNHNAVAHPA
jgi:single-strand DNA-binding protein